MEQVPRACPVANCEAVESSHVGLAGLSEASMRPSAEVAEPR